MKYNLESYCDISKVINNQEYAKEMGIKVKKCDNLFMLNYDKSKLNSENLHTLGLFRSVITDGEKIICFSPPKASSYVDFVKKGINYDDVALESFIEGTMINVFYHNDEWNCATRGNIGAKCKFFRDYPKTYRVLFLEAMTSVGLEFDMLNKDFCYSFVVQHPENRIVVPFSKQNLYLIEFYKCNKWCVETVLKSEAFGENCPNVSNVESIETKFTDYKGKSYSELYDYFTSLNLDYKFVGVMLTQGGNRTKIWNPNYLKVKCLRGNNPKIQFQYYNLLKDKRLGEFLRYYPEYKNTFDGYKNELYNWTEQLWSNYKSCYIRKQKPLGEFPKQFRSSMYSIHQNYLHDLRPNDCKVDKLYVIQYVNNLEPAQLMYLINYVYRKNIVDNEVSNLELSQMTH